MKPLNLSKLRRHKHVVLDGILMEYLTCDTHSATFRRVSDGRRIEFDLTVNNDVMGWNGCTF